MSVSPARRCIDYEEIETEPSAALRISNLPIRCDVNLLRQTFERWGLVTECCIKGGYIPSVCYAFVEFGSIEDSTAAKTHFDLPDVDPINGRRLCVRWARSKSFNIRKSDVQKTSVQKTTVEVFFSFKKSDVTDQVLYEETVSALVLHLIPNATVVDVAIKSYNLCHFTDGITYNGHGHVLFPRTQAAVALAFHLLIEHSNVAVEGLQFNFRVADQSFPCVLRDEPRLLQNRPDLREALKMLLRYKKEPATVVTPDPPLPLVSASEINITHTLLPSPTNRTLNQSQRLSVLPVGRYSPPRNVLINESHPHTPYSSVHNPGMMTVAEPLFAQQRQQLRHPQPQYYQYMSLHNAHQHQQQQQQPEASYLPHSRLGAIDLPGIYYMEQQPQMQYYGGQQQHQPYQPYQPHQPQYQQYSQQLQYPQNQGIYALSQSQLRVEIPAYPPSVPSQHCQNQQMGGGGYYYQPPQSLSMPPLQPQHRQTVINPSNYNAHCSNNRHSGRQPQHYPMSDRSCGNHSANDGGGAKYWPNLKYKGSISTHMVSTISGRDNTWNNTHMEAAISGKDNTCGSAKVSPVSATAGVTPHAAAAAAASPTEPPETETAAVDSVTALQTASAALTAPEVVSVDVCSCSDAVPAPVARRGESKIVSPSLLPKTETETEIEAAAAAVERSAASV